MRAIKITHLNATIEKLSTFLERLNFAYSWKASPKQKTAEA